MGGKNAAIITIVRDEPVFFPIWLGYYSRFFDPSDIYVLDHQTSDGSTSRPGFVRIPVEHETWDIRWMVDTIRDLQHELIERYDCVLVTDVDEIVAPDPAKATLREYIDAFDVEFVNCYGWEILHRTDKEPPFDPGRKVLDQRRFWFESGLSNKPALASVPMEWVPGFHARADQRSNLDRDLYMIHLHRLDYDLCWERHRRSQKRAWNQDDVDRSWGTYHLIDDEEEFRHWFTGLYVAAEPQATESGLKEIWLRFVPPQWRGLF